TVILARARTPHQRRTLPTAIACAGFRAADVRRLFRKFRLFEVERRPSECSKHRCFRVAGGLGFEPRLTESESAVLPLNYPPIGKGYPRVWRPGRVPSHRSLLLVSASSKVDTTPAHLAHLARFSKPQQCRRRSRRAPARHAECHGGDGHQRTDGDVEEHPTRKPMVEKLREDQGRHHAADMKAGGDEAEH